MFLEKVIKDVDSYLSTRQSVNSVLLFPPLNNWRRFLIHQTVCDSYASKHSLSSLSVGVGAARRIVLCDSGLKKETPKATPVKPPPAPILFVRQQNLASPFNLKHTPCSSASERTEHAGPGDRRPHSTSSQTSQLTTVENTSLNNPSRKVTRSKKEIMNIYTPPHLRKASEMNCEGGEGRVGTERRLLTSSENLERICKTDPQTKINRTRRPDQKVYVPRALRSSLPSGTTNTPSAQVPVINNSSTLPAEKSNSRQLGAKNGSVQDKGTRISDYENTSAEDTLSRRVKQSTREIITNNEKITAGNTPKNNKSSTVTNTALQNDYIPPPSPANTLYNSDTYLSTKDDRIPSLTNNVVENTFSNQGFHPSDTHLETRSNKVLNVPITQISQELGQEQNETLNILTNTKEKSSSFDISQSNVEHIDMISDSKSQEMSENGVLISMSSHDINKPIAQTSTTVENKLLNEISSHENDTKMEIDSEARMNVSENDHNKNNIMYANADAKLMDGFKPNTSDNAVDIIEVDNSYNSEEKNIDDSCGMDVQDVHKISNFNLINSKSVNDCHVLIDQASKENDDISSELKTDFTMFSTQGNGYAVINLCDTYNEIPSKVRLVETTVLSKSIEESSESLPSSAYNSYSDNPTETTPNQKIKPSISDNLCDKSDLPNTTRSYPDEEMSSDVSSFISSLTHTSSEPSNSVAQSPSPQKSVVQLLQLIDSESTSESVAEFSPAESLSASSSSVSTPTKSMSQVSLNVPSSYKLDDSVSSNVPSTLMPEVSSNVPSSSEPVIEFSPNIPLPSKPDIEISPNVPSLLKSDVETSPNATSSSKSVSKVHPTVPAPSKADIEISPSVPSLSKPDIELSSILSPLATPVSGKSTGSAKETKTSAPLDLNPDECDWETLYDDDGECLVPDIMNELMNKMGKVSVQTPTQEYRSYQSPEERTSDGENILEIYGFSSTLTNRDLMDVFAAYARTSFNIKWVDDTHALGVFASPLVADEVLNTNLPNVKTRPLREAIPLSRAKAKTLLSAPCGPRPKTCLSSARRLVSGALGIRVQVSESKREEERQILRDAREKKRQEARARQDVWGKD